MKINSKKFIKRRILPAIASVVVFCLVVLLIVATRKTEASADNDKVTIGVKEYTVDNPMTILEIVPDDTYDVFGPLIGKYDTANSDKDVITWDKIIENAPSGETQLSSLKSYISDVATPYIRAMNDNISAAGYQAYIQIGTVARDYGWNVSDDDLKKIKCKLTKDNFKVVFYKGQEKVADVSDIFSYLVFGTTAEDGETPQGILAQGKVQVRVKNAKNITVDDINDAGLVLISSTFGGYVKETYDNIKKYTNKISVTGAGVNNYAWSSSGIDLKPDVAIQLLYCNAKDGKPVIYNAADKGTTSNIGKVANIMNGIENDYLLRDFMRTSTKNGYSGKRGSIYASGNDIKMTLDGNNLEFSTIMFVRDYYGRDGGNNDYYYPVYNTTDGAISQNKLRKNSFVYSEGNQLYQKFTSNISKGNDHDSSGRYLGSYYDDASKKLGTNDIKTCEAIRYIFGAQDPGNISSLKVLEVEPAGYYRFLTDTATRKTETENIIKKWFGITLDDENVDITVEHCTMNGFNGKNVDLAAEYDLIIIGSYGAENLDTSILGNVYSSGNAISGGSTVANAQLNGNDMTEKMYNNLYDYALRGMPLVIDEALYFGDDIASKDTQIHKNVQLDGIVQKVVDATGTTRNISWLKEDGNRKELAKNVYYIDRVSQIETAKADMRQYVYNSSTKSGNSYSMDELSIVDGEFGVNFVESLPAGKYRIKVYIDINQDGIFADDISEGGRELWYYDEISNNRDLNGKLRGKYYEKKSDSSNIITTVKLPASAKGYFSWKVEVIEVADKNTDSALCPKSVNTGAFAIKGVESTVRVLQILGSGGSGALDLKDDEAFNEAFASVGSTTGLELHVTQMTQDELNKAYNTYASDGSISSSKLINEIVPDLETYSMIVMGFSGNYGAESKLADNINGAIRQYIDDGYSVMFTFNTMSTASYTYKDKNDTQNFSKTESVKDYSYLRSDTLGYLPRLSLNKRFTDPYLFTLVRIKDGDKKDNIEYIPYKFNKLIDSPLLVKYGYNGADDYLKNDYIKSSTSNIETNKATELNAGQVTSYPYAINESIDYLEGNSITIAKTHDQFFSLNLEKPSELYDSETGAMNAQPVVWYTFAKSFDRNFSGANDVIGDASDRLRRNIYYSVTDKDAVNNYYIYSYGNVTYTAAGHDSIKSDSELQLFVNTFTKAILSGKHIPTVTYTDATIDDTVTEYTSYTKNMYKKFLTGGLQIKFKIDYLSNVYKIKDAYMYIDLNGDGKYDEDDDIGLGYINATKGTATNPGGVSLQQNPVGITAGVEYTIDDFWTLLSNNDKVVANIATKSKSIDDLKRDMQEGKLNIGIRATSDQKENGKNISGFSILNIHIKDLFDLD